MNVQLLVAAVQKYQRYLFDIVKNETMVTSP